MFYLQDKLLKCMHHENHEKVDIVQK